VASQCRTHRSLKPWGWAQNPHNAQPPGNILPSWPLPFSRGGIYAIINGRNFKIYIGSAADMRSRWAAHRHELLHQKHGNRHLQRAFDASPDSFRFEFVEACSGRDRLMEREQFWMDFYQSHDFTKGYNIHPKAHCPIGKKANPAFLEIMRQKGKRPEHVAHIRARCCKPVIQMDVLWRPIARWESSSDAVRALSKRLDSSSGAIPSVCRGTIEFAYGYRWKFDDGSFDPAEAISPQSAVVRQSKSKLRRVIQMDDLGRHIKLWQSAYVAAKGLCRKQCNIMSAINGVVHAAYGFRWKWDDGTFNPEKAIPTKDAVLHKRIMHDRSQPIVQFDLAGNEIARFDCVKDAYAAPVGIKGSSMIHNCLKRRVDSAAGFVWRYSREC
jgi:hypothetical protein